MIDSKNMQMLKNLFNIQKMAFSLDKSNVGIDMIKNFESTAQKIDQELSTIYNSKLPRLINKKNTIELEEKRLSELTTLIESRINTRKKLSEDYEKATGTRLVFNEEVEQGDKLDYLKSRFETSHTYIEAKECIAKFKKELESLNKELNTTKEEYENNINNNKLFESELKLKFKESTEELEILKDISRSNLEQRVLDAKRELKESEDSLEAFKIAFTAIKKNGLSTEQSTRYEEDYKEFKNLYFNEKKKLLFLNLYAVIHDDISYTYEDMLFKRDKVCSLLLTIIKLKEECHVQEKNCLDSFENLTHKQYEEIKNQYDNVKAIKKLEEKIAFKNNKIEEYEKVLERSDIRKLLIEYSVIESSDGDEDPSVYERVLPKDPIERPNLKPTTIINIFPVYKTMDLGNIKTRTNTVMNRVSRLLGISSNKNIEASKLAQPKEQIVNSDILKVVDPINTNNIITENTNYQAKQDVNDDIFFEMPSLPDNNINNNYNSEVSEGSGFPF